MTDNKLKPTRPSRKISPQSKQGSIFGEAPTKDVELKIKNMGSTEIDAFAKFAQLIMYGIALLAIWGGILSIAFAEDATNQNFLVLGAGGIISALMALALIEMQRKKGGNELQSVHDYLLGISFFFAAVGVLWGSRYLIGVVAGNLDLEWLLVEGIPYSNENWSPSANGIYVQLFACTALIFCEYLYLKKLEGATSFGWSVITFTPLALVVAGVGPWLAWSGNIVSWELGISIVGMSLLSMWLALESNNSLIFSITAVVSGLIPLLYELLNEAADVDGNGGALSLLVFIIIGQGILAADERVRKDLMQLTSIFLIGEVLLAILIVREGDLNLILGPIRESMLNEAAEYINLHSVLWITVLLAYFPAVHKQRIPWMPIGLAGSIWFLEPGASVVAWIISLIVLPYMLIFAKATRSWVANATFIAVSTSFFLQDSVNFWGDVDYVVPEIVITVAICLVIIGELARNFGPLNNWAHFAGVGLIVLSDSILFNGGPLISWILVVYMLGSSWYQLYKASLSNVIKERLDGSLVLVASLLLTVLLSINERLNVPLPDNIISLFDGSNPSVGILAIIIWIGFRRFKNVEFDLGNLFHWLIDSGQKNIPAYDMKDGTWITFTNEENIEENWIKKGWGVIGRFSLISPLFLLSISITSAIIGYSGNEAFWVCLMILPIGILIWELISQEDVSSFDRVLASWIMVLIALPISLELNWLYSKYSDYQEDTGILVDLPRFGDIILSQLIFDILLILGPIILTIILMKRGLNKESNSYEADKWAFLGLLVLSLLDASGGIALITLYGIVIFNSIKYRHFFILTVAPIIFIIAEDNFLRPDKFIGVLIDNLENLELFKNYDLGELTIFGLPRFSCLIIALTGAAILIRSMTDNYNKNTSVEIRDMPNVAGGVWFAIGIWGILPEVSWVLFIITIGLTLQNWFTGKLNFIPYAPAAMLFSLLVAFTLDDNFSGITETELISNTLLGVGLFSLGLHYLARSGLLYKWADDPNNTENNGVINPLNIMPNVESIDGRKKLITNLQYWTIISLLFSWDSIYGIGTIFGAIWITWEIKRNGQYNLILLMPALHAFALWNVIQQIDDSRWESLQNILVGVTLIAEGCAFTYISSKSEIAWNWEGFDYGDEKTYFDWLDRIGIMSLLYIILGIIWIMEVANMDSVMWGIIAIYLSTVAIQGFQEETDAGWRRSIGGFGSLLSLFILSFTIDEVLYQSLTWLALGIVAFGFGMLYMQRFGDETEVYVSEEVGESVNAINEEIDYEDLEIPEPVLEEEEAQDADLIEEVEEVEELPEVVEEESVEDPQPLLKKEIENVIENDNNLVETKEGFFFKLPPEILKNIKKAIDNTDYGDFKPVLEFNSDGQIVLNFE
ncbi:MAG: hypothetical protein CMB64_01195 [Euryarchaeota archaeon]|nr:hypothetical protein [Euryarchaeota archaeon]